MPEGRCCLLKEKNNPKPATRVYRTRCLMLAATRQHARRQIARTCRQIVHTCSQIARTCSQNVPTCSQNVPTCSQSVPTCSQSLSTCCQAAGTGSRRPEQAQTQTRHRQRHKNRHNTDTDTTQERGRSNRSGNLCPCANTGLKLQSVFDHMQNIPYANMLCAFAGIGLNLQPHV